MPDPIQRTMTFLSCTPNQAAAAVLFAALESKHGVIRVGAVRALAERRSRAGHTHLLQRFPRLTDEEQQALAAALRHSTHHMKPALQDAVLGSHLELCESACHVTLLGRVYELLPTLVTATVDRQHPHSDQAAATLVQLARLLQQEISGEARERTCDPFFARRQVLPALEDAIRQYDQHQRLEIVDSFLLLVPPTNRALFDVLSAPAHPCHRPVVESFSTSAITPVLELLTELLHDTTVPRPALDVIAERHDRKFLDHLLHHLGTPVSLRVEENMKRMFSVSWLEDQREVLLELDGAAQAAAVSLAVASSIERGRVLELLKMLLRRGRPEGRCASCDAMSRYLERDATSCVLEAMKDKDPRVQAAAVRQLRRRHVPNAMEKLVGLLDHPAPEVRDAARSSLAEFNFARYQASFEGLDERTRQTTGRLVRKVDRTAARRLADLLSSPSPSIRERGLDMVMAMEASDDVLLHLIPLVADPELSVRADAVAALGLCGQAAALEPLERAAKDANPYVRELAQQGLERVHERLASEERIVAADGERV